MATVLIATEDSTAFSILSAEIEGEGHSALWACDGQEAVDMALEQKPSLVLLDASLPVYSGFEVVEMLRADPEIPRSLPVLLLTDEAIDPHRFEQAGFTEQFPKTHDHHVMREVLSRLTNLSLTPE
jgi:CheY-like chemotaxis protein